ncbi:MAG: hypothetical protein D6737_11080 [Chloroflexi bacterium]|nr:MAG: hypothetical protein D6737_11080 [Chloroflexota bacterium]
MMKQFDQTEIPVRLLVAFYEAFPSQSPQWVVRAPGRDMWLAALPCNDNAYTIIAPDYEGRTSFNLRSARLKRTTLNRPLPHWARYAAGVILQFHEQGQTLNGLDLIMTGEEPEGPRFDYASGMAVAALWHSVHGLPYNAETLIEIVDRVRREYIEV